MSIGNKAAKGFVKLFQRNMLEKIMGLTTIIVLARKLTPYDFGLVSITEVLLYMVTVFGTTGLSEYLLAYRKDDVRETFNAAFWFNLVVTIILLLAFFAIIPLWAMYQHEPRIVNIGFIIAGIFIFSQLSVIPKAWLGRNLMFDRQVKIQTPFIILLPLAKVAAVYAGMGVYSLVVPTLLLTPIQTLLFYKATDIRPGTVLQVHRWKEIYRFTRHLIGSALLRRLADHGDKFILGKFLGLGMLGIYNIAMNMAELFTTQLIMVSNNVLSSVLPKYVDDKKRFYHHYIYSLKTFSFLLLPFMVAMILAAKPIVLLVYGEKWLDAVLPMQILIVYSALRSVTSSFSVVMNSFHKNRESFRVNLFFTPVHLVGSVIGAYFFGIVGVALSLVFVRVVFYNWRIMLTMEAVQQPVLQWYRDIYPYFLSALISICICWLVIDHLLQAYSSFPVLTIAITGLSVVTVYNVFVKIVFPGELKMISSFLASTFPAAQKHFNRIYSIHN